jgi:hypothetical protein
VHVFVTVKFQDTSNTFQQCNMTEYPMPRKGGDVLDPVAIQGGQKPDDLH